MSWKVYLLLARCNTMQMLSLKPSDINLFSLAVRQPRLK